ncbi:probable pectinesterase/pectinesterase inhibitor 12 [Rutidosis leptorrhynchoides]|uniref:probable pectinesterase/pectinesterase inhibitor 12 n=1 Tax=Rutidosis leptorrhynchoides TaxID=125765 RepID=UPI003A99FB44
MITFPFHILFILLCLLLKHQQALSLTSHINSTNCLTRSAACKSTPYPDVCKESLKISVSINISINIDIIIIQQSLKVAISEGVKLLNMISNTNNNNGILEKHKGTIQDCKELHQITLSSLKKSLTATTSSPFFNNKLADTKTFLSAAVTNKNTCLEGLESASGPLKPLLVDTIIAAYKHVSNSLSLVSKTNLHTNISNNDDDDDDDNDDDDDDDNGDGDDDDNDDYYTFTVATDGSGNFSTITDAINFAPNNSLDRVIIYIKQGLYQENVEIPSYKPNIVLLGDGSGMTIITGNRSVVDGWTTFRSATVAVSGERFLARDIGFHNTAGAEKHQAVALRINADFAAVYRCVISGYQDTLYVHSFRQFYRECDIYGTIDYVFGNAAVVFQGCNIISRMPMPGQFTVISAHSRDSPDQQTGISFQNCSVLATEDLRNTTTTTLVKSYLGRPWKPYSRTVFIESYIDDLIDPAGWIHWSSGDQGLDTLYYGEYGNDGPGSRVDGRVTWPGYHLMDYYEASNFTVSQLITGQEWLDSTSFPYDDWV